MKFLVAAFFFLCWVPVFSQLDLPSSNPVFGNTNSSGNDAGLLNIPKSENPGFNLPKNNKGISDLGKEEEKPFSMIDDEYKEYKSNIVPKYFSQDKEIKPEYGKDMYLGDFKTKAKSVTILYRDHEYVDGDRVRIFVNDEVVVNNVMLEADFRGFDLPLQDGFNKIEFQALNQGTSGPNTAQLQIRDEIGNILASYEWNLLTGRKATAIIVKQ
ncbi:MAG TPA: hypothetical protein VFF21_00470 [Flavobacteriaceae bacterium]|nr:hypothetical protein [Flavobacteriaceae bacterium]